VSAIPPRAQALRRGQGCHADHQAQVHFSASAAPRAAGGL